MFKPTSGFIGDYPWSDRELTDSWYHWICFSLFFQDIRQKKFGQVRDSRNLLSSWKNRKKPKRNYYKSNQSSTRASLLSYRKKVQINSSFINCSCISFAAHSQINWLQRKKTKKGLQQQLTAKKKANLSPHFKLNIHGMWNLIYYFSLMFYLRPSLKAS